MGNKVNKIIRADDFAYSGKSLDQNQGPSSQNNNCKTNDRLKIYENKIKLMIQQIDGLKKDLAVKVKFDQRKLKYARETLAQFDEHVLGRQGHYGKQDGHAISIQDLPNFPSPYASQQNSVSRNQLLNPLDIKLSDQYECLPVYFQYLIPKTHLNLIQLIEFYDRFEIKKELPKDGYEKAYWWVFKSNFSDDEVMQCEVCFQPVGRRWHHVLNVHQDILCAQFNKPKRPKGLLQNTLLRDGICPIGCGYKSTNSEIRMHLIYFHSQVQLQQWQINRNFLRYQEGFLTRREFIKTIVTRTDSIFDNEKGAVKDAYDHSPEAYQNMLTFRESVTDQDRVQERLDNTIDIETYDSCKVEQILKDEIQTGNHRTMSNIENSRRNNEFNFQKYDKSMELIGLKSESIKAAVDSSPQNENITINKDEMEGQTCKIDNEDQQKPISKQPLDKFNESYQLKLKQTDQNMTMIDDQKELDKNEALFRTISDHINCSKVFDQDQRLIKGKYPLVEVCEQKQMTGDKSQASSLQSKNEDSLSEMPKEICPEELSSICKKKIENVKRKLKGAEEINFSHLDKNVNQQPNNVVSEQGRQGSYAIANLLDEDINNDIHSQKESSESPEDEEVKQGLQQIDQLYNSINNI